MDFVISAKFYIKLPPNRSNIKCFAMLTPKAYSTVELCVKSYNFTAKNHKTDPKDYLFGSVLL